jgi:hypothetical protein
VIRDALDDYSPVAPGSVTDVLEADATGRELASAAVSRRSGAGIR